MGAENGAEPAPHTLRDHDGPQDLAEMVHQALHLQLEIRDLLAQQSRKPKPHPARRR